MCDLEKLKELCDEYFVDVMVHPYAGSNAECMFCGATDNNGKVDHSYVDCPVIKYKEIIGSIQ